PAGEPAWPAPPRAAGARPRDAVEGVGAGVPEAVLAGDGAGAADRGDAGAAAGPEETGEALEQGVARVGAVLGVAGAVRHLRPRLRCRRCRGGPAARPRPAVRPRGVRAPRWSRPAGAERGRRPGTPGAA